MQREITSGHVKRQIRYWIAPVFPLLAVACALSACAPVAASTGANAEVGATNRQSPATQGYPLGKSPLWDGVRLSRGFFEDQSVYGAVSLFNAAGIPVYEGKSTRVNWQIGDPVAPNPEPGYNADFRDRPGCAEIENGLQVCFVTAPDVSTLEVNLKKAYVENLTIWLTQALPSQDTCTPEVKYVDASRGAKTLNIVFQIAGCSDQPLRAEFAFQAV